MPTPYTLHERRRPPHRRLPGAHRRFFQVKRFLGNRLRRSCAQQANDIGTAHSLPESERKRLGKTGVQLQVWVERFP